MTEGHANQSGKCLPPGSTIAQHYLRHGHDHAVNLLHWDGHPVLLGCLEQLKHIFRGIHSALNMSVQLVSNVFDLILGHGIGRPGENLDFVVCKKLCGIACCMESGVLGLKCNIIQHLMAEIKQQKKKKKEKKIAFLFLNSTVTHFQILQSAL